MWGIPWAFWWDKQKAIWSRSDEQWHICADGAKCNCHVTVYCYMYCTKSTMPPAVYFLDAFLQNKWTKSRLATKCNLSEHFSFHQHVRLISSMSQVLFCVRLEQGKFVELSKNISLNRTKKQQKLLVHLNTSATEPERVHSAKHFRDEMRFKTLTLWQDRGVMFPEMQHKNPPPVLIYLQAWMGNFWGIRYAH